MYYILLFSIDALIVMKQLKPFSHLFYAYPDKFEEFSQKAKELSTWCKEYQEMEYDSRHWFMDLSSLQLNSVPKEIVRLLILRKSY